MSATHAPATAGGSVGGGGGACGTLLDLASMHAQLGSCLTALPPPLTDAQGIVRVGSCNDGGKGDANPLAQLCDLGTDCDDCGVRLFCESCPPACHARNMQRPAEGSHAGVPFKPMGLDPLLSR